MFSRASKGLVLALSLAASTFAVGCAGTAEENVGSDEGAATAAANLATGYEGTIGNLKVLVRIEATGSAVAGSYFYSDKVGNGDTLILRGKIAGNKITMTESVNGQGATTGTFEGTIGANGITGTWKAGATTLPLNLAAIKSLKIATRKFQATAPLPAGEDDFHKCEVGGEALEVYGLAPAAQKQIVDALKIEPIDKDERGECISDKRNIVQSVKLNTAGVLTVEVNSEYWGGAHPSYSGEFYNFTIADGVRHDGNTIFKAGTELAVKELVKKAIQAQVGTDQFTDEDAKEQIAEFDNHWDAETKFEDIQIGILDGGLEVNMGNNYPHVILALAPLVTLAWSDVKPLLAANGPAAPIAK